MLICDGHDSHITGDFIEHCMNHKIHIMILPPHSSHLTQPLDVGVFGALKKVMASKLEPILRTGISCLQKVEWTGAFVAAHERVFREQNIQSGFRGTGIYPYQPTKVLRQIIKPSSSSPSTPSTSPTSNTPFTNAVLTSSPADLNAIRAANKAFNNLLDSGEAISTPAKQYFNYLARTSERNWTRKIILEQEKADLQTVVAIRKTRLSGKRKVIDGDTLITTVEKLNGIKAAEKKTQQTGSKRQKVVRRTCSKVQQKSSDESEVDSDDNIGGLVEVLDCIEVQ
jgi:DDE superfamily endonuclease